MRTSGNILLQKAAQKVLGKLSYDKFSKETWIPHFFKILEKEDQLPKLGAWNWNTPVQIALSSNHYLLEVLTSENILPQKAALKVHGKSSYHKFGKDT